MATEADLKNTCAFALSGPGTRVLKKLKENFPDLSCYTKSRYLSSGLLEITDFSYFFKKAFFDYDAIIAICACGIVVRSLGPLLDSKFTDPAVIVIDPKGKYVIPVLSGHIGGANRLAEKIAAALGAKAVITTASDNEGVISVDLYAKKHGCRFDRDEALALTSLLLDHKKIAVVGFDELLSPECELLTKEAFEKRAGEFDGLIVRGECRTSLPAARLLPRSYVVGLGMKKDLSESVIKESLLYFLEENGIKTEQVLGLATIPLKAKDKNLRKVLKDLGIELTVVEMEDLKKVEDRFKKSDFVKKTVGVGAVSEPCGYLASDYGKCVKSKTKRNGVTLSLWEKSTLSESDPVT